MTAAEQDARHHVADFRIRRMGTRWYCELRVDGRVMCTSTLRRERADAIADRDAFQRQMREQLGATRSNET